MGSIPLRATSALRDTLGLARAVETGTYQGDGAYELSRVFPSVVSIELSPELHAIAQANLREVANVTLVQGDSRVKLREFVRPDVPTLYFLDGHWCDGFTGGADNQCPVVEELATLTGGHPDDCIVIDDARFFLAPPPPPYEPRNWPSIVELLDAMHQARPSHHIAIFNDQVYAVPPRARPVLDELGQLSHQAGVRPRLRRLLGDRLTPWSPTRRRLAHMQRRLSATVNAPRR